MDEPLTIGLVHPGTLPMTVYRPLATALAPRIAVEIIAMHRLPEFQAAMTTDRVDVTVERLAESLLAQPELRRHAGDRGYLLAGWSFGGLVALALADRLAGMDNPRHVVLFDTVASWAEPGLSERDVEPRQVIAWFCMLLGARVGRAFPIGPDRADASLDEVLAHVLDQGLREKVLSPVTTVEWLGDLLTGFVHGIRRSGRIAEAYRPQRLPDRLTVVKPEGSLFPGNSRLGWQPAPGFRIVACPGDHYSVLTDPAAVARLTVVLRAAALDLATPHNGNGRARADHVADHGQAIDTATNRPYRQGRPL